MFSHVTRRALVLAAAGMLISCSFIRFERGPYAIRGLEVVYSEQEDTTFFVWRIRQDADTELVRFELWRDGEFRPLDLDEAPFPAEPYECGDFLCYQFQLDGRYELPEDVESPLRSIHEEEGLYAGSKPRFSVANETFWVDPIGIENNEKIDAELSTWFEDNDVPMKRDYEWTFSSHASGSCEEPSGSGWDHLDDPIDVDHAWVEREQCFSARPTRPDGGDVTTYTTRLVPSAETHVDEQTYVPRVEESPIAYGILVDLEIANEERCAQTKSDLIETIDDAFSSRGATERLDVYTPLSPDTGLPLDGCQQDPMQDYPVELMIRDARQITAASVPRRVRVVWIYINNIELPPSERIVQQLTALGNRVLEDTELDIYTWAIGSNAILALFPWDQTTGWRPIDDETFQADIRAFAKSTLPFRTMDHDDETEVSISLPEGATSPKSFKICSSTPVQYSAIGTLPGNPFYGVADPAVPWPQQEGVLPFFQVPLEPQVLVAYDEYVRRRVDLVVEVCERFCDGPFRTRGGVRHPQWNATLGSRAMEVCRWRE